MKKIIMVLVTVAIVTFGFSGGAYALNYYDYEDLYGAVTSTYSGDYIFTVTNPKNDTEATMDLDALEGAVKDWLWEEKGISYTVDFAYYSKVDAPADTGDGMTVTYYTGNQTGEWTTETAVQFYTVKASTEFALYWLGENGASSGEWTTEHLLTGGSTQPTISHLSTWNSVDGTTPVPEPGTMVLLGAGLFGLGWAGRRRKK